MKTIEISNDGINYTKATSKEELLEDYIDFIIELDKKFDFFDIEKFNNDFFDFIVKIQSIKDVEKIQELFFVLIHKHAKNRDLDSQVLNIIKELELKEE
ncbi:MAG: hypothetical protein M0R03_20040 [Novosphingobium sp.]|jgi:hypothetical protein|nr:hypothetical protein [Novosphingobium sp.]